MGRALTVERVHKLLSYNPTTGVFTWLSRETSDFTDDRVCNWWNTRYAGKVAGCPDKYGYIKLKIDRRLYFAHRLAWLHMTGECPVLYEIDHINGVHDDNRFVNLRLATRSQNACNRGPQANNIAGEKGVHWDASYPYRCKWRAQMCRAGEYIYLGRYETKEEAVAAYAAAAQKYHGEFARSS